MIEYIVEFGEDYENMTCSVRINAENPKEALEKANKLRDNKNEIVIQIFNDDYVVYDFMNGFFKPFSPGGP